MTSLQISGRFIFAQARKRGNVNHLNGWKAACTVFALCAAATISAEGQTFTVWAPFEGTNGIGPSSLVQGTDGNLYGTTDVGGVPCNNWDGCGTVFKLDPAGEITTLHSFSFPSDWSDGTYPAGPLVLATDGNFYGMTGTIGWQGTVFKITPGGTLTTLYMFCSQPNCSDGAAPDAGLIQGADGNFYGVTYRGGTGRQLCFTGGVGSGTCGTVFKITPTGKLTTLYSFCSKANCTDGGGPSAALVQATDGDFYGTTNLGGSGCYGYGCGTLFKITPTGVLTTLHTFCAEPNCADGGGPGVLVKATDGNLYGTTGAGGGAAWPFGGGTLFKITPTGKLTTLYSFCSKANCTDGGGPSAALVQATDGNFYGATGGGGAFGGGTLFKITPTGKLTTLYSFCAQSNCPDGTNPTGLFQATNGKFYGTADKGGDPNCWPAGSCGAAFSLDTGIRPFVSFIRNSGKVGQTVQVLGWGFTETKSVSFNGTPAPFTVKSDTYLTATVPPGATTGFVNVATPGGTLKSSQIFRVTPQILSFSPASGPVGTSVVITGKSFRQASVVTLACKWPMSFTVDSDAQITAIVPPGATKGRIAVRTAGGRVESTASFSVTD